MPAEASQILAEYRRRTPTSERLAMEARRVFPSGLTHDARHLEPYTIYVDRAQGAHKWDVDGNEYVDYFGGHGALLLGHGHPAVTQAITEQAARGTHFGASHELELRWAQRVQELVPSAERVRFTSSGTEATLLAFRLARAFTGRRRIIRLHGHFHGWQDHVAFGVASHHDGSASAGVLPEIAQSITLCPPGDVPALREQLGRGDVAALILEPTGATWGQVPITGSYLQATRELTAQSKTLLIFDEVVSGFRVAPGGAQAHFGIRPDLSTLAKILAGGLPGGALVGRKDVLDLLDFEECVRRGCEKISHQGTYNANPLSAAAGISALGIVATTDACQKANDFAARLREALRRVLRDEGIDWTVYGTFSSFHLFTNPDHEPVTAEDIESGKLDYRKLKGRAPRALLHQIRMGMLAAGVDICGWPGGPTSAVHDSGDLDWTADAFRRTLRLLKADGAIPTRR